MVLETESPRSSCRHSQHLWDLSPWASDRCLLTVSGTAFEWSEWVKSLSHVRFFATPWTVTYQAPLSMGFSRQEYWSGLPLPSPGDLPPPRDWTRVSRILSPWASDTCLLTVSGTTFTPCLWVRRPREASFLVPLLVRESIPSWTSRDLI